MPGSPTEVGLYNDARAYINALVAKGGAPAKMIFFGQSLGTGVAVQMAVEFKAGGLMLMSALYIHGQGRAVSLPGFSGRLSHP